MVGEDQSGDRRGSRRGEGVRAGRRRQRVLDGLSLEVEAGRFVAVMGPSGSGKSTLLHLLGGLDTPDSGEVELDGTPLSSLKDDARTELRRQQIGIVYQFFNLVPVLTAAENIALPAVIAGERRGRPTARRLDDVLELVGLGEHRDKQPSQLSGGQQQRAAIARALFIEPAVLLADEPTGNLDLASGAEVLGLFLEAQRALGQTDRDGHPRPAQRRLRRRGPAPPRRLRCTASSTSPAAAAATARTDRTHEGRTKAVLRWLEDLDATGASGRHAAAGSAPRPDDAVAHRALHPRRAPPARPLRAHRRRASRSASRCSSPC